MKIIIAGAGEVGIHLAKMLSNENHEITIIDPDENKLKNLASNLDVLSYNGSATSIQVLKNAKYKYFEQEKGLKIAYSNHTVTPLHPSKRIAKLFNISLDTPILQVANTTWLTNGQIMDYTVLTLNSPIYQLTYEKR